MTLTIATRGSPLALWQAQAVKRRLEEVHAGLEVVVHIVKTEGDRVQDRPIEALSLTGVFTKEVDACLASGKADAAVHSLKDQFTTLPDGICLGMVLPRGPVEDVLVATGGGGIADLVPGARVATGSLRRRAQILRARPDLKLVPIRGNVGARLRKLDAGEADALVLARAGLERLGLGSRVTEVIERSLVLPAVSQGIVGVTCRVADETTRARLRAADDPVTRACATAERAWLERIGGGCNVPAAAHAVIEHDRLLMSARVLDPDGRDAIEADDAGDIGAAEAIGYTLADALIDRGALDLVRGGGS